MAKEANNTATLDFPLGGIDLSGPFDMQAPGTTPAGTNVRSFEPLTLRARGGSRPGLERYLGALPTGSVIQLLDFIVDPQEDALTVDTDDDPLAPFGVEYIDDPSSNNFSSRNPPGRRVRKGGSGYQSNRHKPAGVGTKKTPIINWAADQGEQNYGIPLIESLGGATQLNATATDAVTGLPVAGTFEYSPAAGVILAVGARALACTFTPTDTAAYNSASATSTITVTHVDTPYASGHGFASNSASSITDSVGATSVTMSINGSSEDPYGGVTCVHAIENSGNYPGDFPNNGSSIGIEWYADNDGPVDFPDGGNFLWTFRAS